jgi:hypothetical protein
MVCRIGSFVTSTHAALDGAIELACRGRGKTGSSACRRTLRRGSRPIPMSGRLCQDQDSIQQTTAATIQTPNVPISPGVTGGRPKPCCSTPETKGRSPFNSSMIPAPQPSSLCDGAGTSRQPHRLSSCANCRWYDVRALNERILPLVAKDGCSAANPRSFGTPGGDSGTSGSPGSPRFGRLCPCYVVMPIAARTHHRIASIHAESPVACRRLAPAGCR